MHIGFYPNMAAKMAASTVSICNKHFSKVLKAKMCGPNRDLNPGPPPPKGGIMPLDHWDFHIKS